MTHRSNGERPPGEQVAFLVGAGRSGTTLLHKLLCLHPQIAYISNYENRFAGFRTDWPPGRLRDGSRTSWTPGLTRAATLTTSSARG